MHSYIKFLLHHRLKLNSEIFLVLILMQLQIFFWLQWEKYETKMLFGTLVFFGCQRVKLKLNAIEHKIFFYKTKVFTTFEIVTKVSFIKH